MTGVAMIGITAKRFIMALMGLVLLGVTFEAVRRRALRERYAILWVLSGVVVLVSAACPSLPELVARALGITFIEGASYLFAFFLVMVVFHISTAISRIRADLEAEARRSALLQAEVERLAARDLASGTREAGQDGQRTAGEKLEGQDGQRTAREKQEGPALTKAETPNRQTT